MTREGFQKNIAVSLAILIMGLSVGNAGAVPPLRRPVRPHNPPAAESPTPVGTTPTSPMPDRPTMPEASLPKPVQAFVDVTLDRSILPVDIDPSITPKQIKSYGPTGTVKERQDTIVKPRPQAVLDLLLSHQLTERFELPQGTVPQITLANHYYWNESWDANFKILIKVGKNEYVAGFPPRLGPGRPDLRNGDVKFPEQTIIREKKWYDRVVAGEEPNYRQDGPIIQMKVGDMWVDYMNAHWPYNKSED